MTQDYHMKTKEERTRLLQVIETKEKTIISLNALTASLSIKTSLQSQEIEKLKSQKIIIQEKYEKGNLVSKTIMSDKRESDKSKENKLSQDETRKEESSSVQNETSKDAKETLVLDQSKKEKEVKKKKTYWFWIGLGAGVVTCITTGICVL
jgi:hypothetical protein